MCAFEITLLVWKVVPAQNVLENGATGRKWGAEREEW